MQRNITSAGGSKLVFWIVGALGVLALLGGVAAYIFLVYLPGTTENRYRTGFESVGQGMDYLVEESDIIEQISSTSYSGEMELEFSDEWTGDFEVNVSVDGEYDTQNASFVLEADGSMTDRLGVGSETYEASGKVDLRFLGPTVAKTPRFYFKLSELKLPTQFDEYFEGSEAEWQDVWWLLDLQELIDEGALTDEDLEGIDLQKQLTQEDYEELTLILISNLREYIFTSETDKMVFQMDELLGQEAFKGVQTHKYSVTVSEQNLQDLVVSMRDDFAASSVWQKFSEELDLEESGEEDSLFMSDEEIQELAVEFSENIKVEVWIDSESRVLRNLRFSDADPKSSSHGSYLDFGIILEDPTIGLEMNTVLYSDDNCREVLDIGVDTFSFENEFEDTRSEPDVDASKCPYVFEEADEVACGEEPDYYDDYLDDVDEKGYNEDYWDWDAYDEQYAEYSAARAEYQRCQAPVRSLKENAPVIGEMTFKMVVNTEANSVSYELEVDAEGTLSISLSLEFVGQAEVVEVEEPEDARSVFSFFEEASSALSANAENAQIRADIGGLRAQMQTYSSNNNGQLPEGTQSAADMDALSGLYLGYYSIDDITYFDSDFDSDNPSGEFALESQSIDSSRAHIWQGRACQTNLAPAEEYPSGVLTTESNQRTLAFVYVLTGTGTDLESGAEEIHCEDNV